MSDQSQIDMDNTKELFDFLQGAVPKDIMISADHIPHLTADQAWTVIWYLGNKYWQVTDRIERCEVCGNLYHAECGGDCLDFGSSPYHFCDSCMESNEYAAKKLSDPDYQPETDSYDEQCYRAGV